MPRGVYDRSKARRSRGQKRGGRWSKITRLKLTPGARGRGIPHTEKELSKFRIAMDRLVGIAKRIGVNEATQEANGYVERLQGQVDEAD